MGRSPHDHDDPAVLKANTALQAPLAAGYNLL